MQPEIILQSDVLDIIFENRNKAYGAYALRKQYDRRLLGSVSLVITCILIWFLFSFFKYPDRRSHGPYLKPVDDSTKLFQIPDQQPPPPSPPPPPPPPPQTVASIDNRMFKIVRDDLADKTPLATTDEMEDRVISTITQEGTPDENIQPPVSDAQKAGITEAPSHEEEPEIFRTVEVMPRFPGGNEALGKFLRQNLRTPEEDMGAGTRITVRVQFVVQKDGSIGDVEVLQSGGKPFDAEVTRVLNKMPSWTPGSQNGRNVAVYFTLPIVFETTEE